MARVAPFGLALLLLGALLLTAPRVHAQDDEDESEADQLRATIAALSSQIKEAEVGKTAAERLLSVGQEKQKASDAELASLKASVLAKEEQSVKLQRKLNALQEEAGKLRGEGRLQDELKAQLKSATDEVEATKATLAQTLQQLADKTGLAGRAESQVAEAERRLEAAQKEAKAAAARVAELESSAADASSLQKALDAERKRAAKLEGSLDKLGGEAKQLRADLAGARAELKDAQKQASEWRAKAERAQAAVAAAELRLDKAMQEHSATKQAMLEAEARAHEAVSSLELLLSSWLPHWLGQYYDKVRQAVQPAVDAVQPGLQTAWEHGQRVGRQGHSHALWAYGVTRARSLQAWEQAQPTLRSLAEQSKKHAGSAASQIGRAAVPHVAGLRRSAGRAWQSLKAKAGELLQLPQVAQLQRRAQRTFRQLEGLAIKQLKRVPQLRQYAKRPTVTYLVAGLLTAPLVTLLVPLLALGRGKKASASNGASQRAGAGAGAAAAKPKGKKAPRA